MIKDIKNPRHIALSALICLFCIILGYVRGSIAASIAGLIMGIILSLIGILLNFKHRERQKDIRESIIIPKIGLIILYWISPIIYYTIQAVKR